MNQNIGRAMLAWVRTGLFVMFWPYLSDIKWTRSYINKQSPCSGNFWQLRLLFSFFCAFYFPQKDRLNENKCSRRSKTGRTKFDHFEQPHHPFSLCGSLYFPQEDQLTKTLERGSNTLTAISIHLRSSVSSVGSSRTPRDKKYGICM